MLDDNDADKLKESKAILSSLAELIYEMRHDRELSPLSTTGLPDDTSEYNAAIEEANASGTPLKWFNASWLYAECYMYRRIRGIFASTEHWKLFDCFASQKLEAFRSSSKGIMTLAQSVQQLVAQGPPTDEEILHADWIKMLEVCLWGASPCGCNPLQTANARDYRQCYRPVTPHIAHPRGYPGVTICRTRQRIHAQKRFRRIMGAHSNAKGRSTRHRARQCKSCGIASDWT